jgi:O-antigen/teichoic acid export membrane protein
MSAAITAPLSEGRGARRQISWGLIDQGFSSATNFGLAVLAGRLLGPGGLGVVYLGFSIYLIIMTLQRSLITDPLVVVSSRARNRSDRSPSRNALTMALGWAGTLSALSLIGGLILPSPYGRALILFTPWLAGSLLQDLWRSILFRDKRGAAAALNDGVWALGMIAIIPLALLFPNEWVVVASWGFGALAGGLLGFAQTRLRPSSLIPAVRWWAQRLWPLGRWFGCEQALLLCQTQLVVIFLTSTLGTSAVGGVRAVDAVFAPMTLLAQAFGFPGLPLLARESAVSRARARVLAAYISLAATVIVLLYLVLVVVFRGEILHVLFGADFVMFASLALPTGVRQLVLSASIGFSMLVRAEGRGRALLAARAVGSASTVSLVAYVAPRYGLHAALWAIAAGYGLGCLTMIAFALRAPRPPTEAAEAVV